MKKFILILLVLITSSYAWAEKEYSEGGLMRLDVKNKQAAVLIDGDWEWCSFSQITDLLNDNIYGFFSISNITTPLEKRAFERTAEYQDSILPKFKEIKQHLLSTYYAIEFNLEGNIPYDINRDCFTFRIGFPYDSRTKRPDYIFFDDLCVSMPAKNIVINQQNIGGRYSLSQFVLTPKVPEEIALKIEQGMKQRECPYELLFIVKFDKLIERPSVFGQYYYILTKAVGLCILDEENGKEVINFDSIFKESTPKSTSKPRTGTNTRRRTNSRK